jgi:hypothetical protein
MRGSNTYLEKAAGFLRFLDEETEEERKQKTLRDWKVLCVLRRYEGYRRGTASKEDCPTPSEITFALEEVIREFKKRFS